MLNYDRQQAGGGGKTKETGKQGTTTTCIHIYIHTYISYRYMYVSERYTKERGRL